MTTTESQPADTWNTPHLQGLMAPVFEERDDTDLAVVGEIPAALNGMFVRTGPNPQFAPLGAYHPFDGDGMLHAVYLADGKARYRNRWVESKGLLAERKRGRACYGGMSNYTIPDEDVLAEGGMLKNTANTATVRHNGRYFGLLEAAPPTEFNRELETLGEWDWGGKLQGPMTAHPKLDPVSGEMIFFGYRPVAPFLMYHEVNAAGELAHSAPLDIPAPVMMHDFAITENFALFMDSPAVFDLEALFAGGEAMGWQPDNGTRLGVLPRGGTNDDIRWFEVPNCYVVHFMNAQEDGDTITLRAPSMPDMPGGLKFEDPDGAREPNMWKWTIDLAAGTVSDEQTDDVPGEFPRVNENLTGRATRYGYNCTARGWEFDFDFTGVVKYDFEADSSSAFTYADTQVSGEHMFAPDPNGTAEDDGWLMTFVTDRTTEQSELAIIDARDVEAGPVARVQMAARVPLGFHANWFAD
ncbi:MAG: carotenoid oxygenase family protein [Acidimicrobiales bacterium]|nr:carotenoid oxygenase family protein [Acidimicrobiales bacterium]